VKITIYRTAAVDPAILAEIPSAVIEHEHDSLTWRVEAGVLLVTRPPVGYGDGQYPALKLTWGYPTNAIDRFEIRERP